MAIGEADYRAGARERLEEAFALLRGEYFGGSIYLAGRAVEGILRAVIRKSDPDYATGRKTLETGHDLRELFRLVQNLGAVADEEVCDSIGADVEKINRLWWNNLRFLATAKVQTRWYNLGETDRRRSMKQATLAFFNACSIVVKKCEALWRR